MNKEIRTLNWEETALKHLSAYQRDALFAVSAGLHWPARKRVVFHPDSANTLYLVIEGKVKLGRALPEKREDYHRLAGPLDWVGDLALLSEEYPPFFAMAAQPTQVLAMPLSTVRKVMMEAPTFNLAILQYMTYHLRRLQQRREAMLRQPTRLRILAFLCEYCESFGELRGDYLRIDTPLSHTDIGKFTGTSRQSVNALMSALRRENLIDYDQDFIAITPPNLQELHTQRKLPIA